MRRCTCKVNEQHCAALRSCKHGMCTLLWPEQRLTWARCLVALVQFHSLHGRCRSTEPRMQLHDCATGRCAVLHVVPDRCPPGAMLTAEGGLLRATEAADRKLWVGAQDPVAPQRVKIFFHPAANTGKCRSPNSACVQSMFNSSCMPNLRSYFPASSLACPWPTSQAAPQGLPPSKAHGNGMICDWAQSWAPTGPGRTTRDDFWLFTISSKQRCSEMSPAVTCDLSCACVMVKGTCGRFNR